MREREREREREEILSCDKEDRKVKLFCRLHGKCVTVIGNEDM